MRLSTTLQALLQVSQQTLVPVLKLKNHRVALLAHVRNGLAYNRDFDGKLLV